MLFWERDHLGRPTKRASHPRPRFKVESPPDKEKVTKKPSAAEKRSSPRPKRAKLSREEVLKRMRTISEWREKTLAEFKRRYPGAFREGRLYSRDTHCRAAKSSSAKRGYSRSFASQTLR
jgi:hypothetical protein